MRYRKYKNKLKRILNIGRFISFDRKLGHIKFASDTHFGYVKNNHTAIWNNDRIIEWTHNT